MFGRSFWARGYCVSTVGLDEDQTRQYIREQEKLQFLRQFRQSVDPDVPWAGFYTIGEIGPVEKHNDPHLLTSVVLALS